MACGDGSDLVLVHLVQVDECVFGAEKTLAGGSDVDAGVAEFPIAGGFWCDGCAEEAGEQLVAEADACEAKVFSRRP